MKKKLWALLLTAAMVFSLASATTLTAAAEATELPDQQDNVITMTQDVKLSRSFVVSKGQTLTLYLNGWKLTGPATGPAIKVDVGGNLTIKDKPVQAQGSGSGDGTIYRNSNSTSNDYMIWNDGTVLAEGIKLEAEDGSNTSGIINNKQCKNDNPAHMKLKNVTMSVGSSSLTIKNDEYGILEIEGGSYTNTSKTLSGDGQSRQACIISYGDLTIHSGTFSACGEALGVKCYSSQHSTATIKGGTFSSEGGATITAASLAFGIDMTKDGKSTALQGAAITVNIEGGNFKNDIVDSATRQSLIENAAGEKIEVLPTLNLKGGYFAKNPQTGIVYEGSVSSGERKQVKVVVEEDKEIKSDTSVNGCNFTVAEKTQEPVNPPETTTVKIESSDDPAIAIYKKYEISGLNNEKVYAIRLAKDQAKNNGEMTVLIVDQAASYTLYAKADQNIWVFEFDQKSDIQAGEIPNPVATNVKG